MTALYGPGQVRRGVAADWSSENPVLLAGELGVTREAGGWNLGVKVGDGATAWNALGFGPDVLGALVNDGYMYGNAQKGALAFGFAHGANAHITPDDYGSAAGGCAYSDTGLGVAARVVATAPGSFAHGKAYLYGGSASGYAEVGARSHGAHAFGYAYSASDGKALMASTGLGSMVVGYVYGSNPSLVAQIIATGRGSFAGGFANEAAGSIVASGSGIFQWGPGTNSEAHSLAVGPDLRLNGAGVPGTPRNGDMWVAGGFIYARTNGVTGKVQVA